jgi:hypothetical protein
MGPVRLYPAFLDLACLDYRKMRPRSIQVYTHGSKYGEPLRDGFQRTGTEGRDRDQLDTVV